MNRRGFLGSVLAGAAALGLTKLKPAEELLLPEIRPDGIESGAAIAYDIETRGLRDMRNPFDYGNLYATSTISCLKEIYEDYAERKS